MRKQPDNPSEAYQIDDDPPTLTLVADDQTIAFPYHLVRALRMDTGGHEIVIDYDEHEVRVRGSGLGRLWKELRSFRVREVSINGGAAARAVGGRGARTFVESIRIVAREGDGTPDE